MKSEDTITVRYNPEFSIEVEASVGAEFLQHRHCFMITVGDTEIGPIISDRVMVTQEPYSVHIRFLLTPDEATQYVAAQQRYRTAHPYTPDGEEMDDEEEDEEPAA